MAATTKKKRGRPRKPDSEKRRHNVTIRMKDDIKRRLQEAADSQGRSLSEEIEFSLERRFLEETIYGGKELNGMLMLMVGAAEIIQDRTGKSWSSDWDTWVAVQAAWKYLGVAAGPLPPKEWLKALGEASKVSSTIPLEPPPEDAEPSVRAAYLTESANKIAAFSAFHHYQENDRAQEVIGEDVAAEILPRREAVTETGNPS